MDLTPALLASLNVTRRQFEVRCASIVAMCQADDCLVLLACIRLYDKQTADEQRMDVTVHDNDMGFQFMDAKFGSKMARLLKAGETIYTHNMPRLRRMAYKYRRQLTIMSFLKDRAKVEAVAKAA